MVSTSSSSRPSGRSAASKSQPANQLDPWILWVTFRRCWYWAVPLGILLAGLAAGSVLQSFVPRYRATHLLEANQDYLVFKGVMPTISDIASTENPLFFNPIVLDSVLADPALRVAPSLADPETAERNLRKNLKVTSPGTKTRLEVSYEDTDQEAAAMVCNAVVDSYLRQRDSFDNTRVSNLERWLEPEIQRWQQEVDQRQRSVQTLSKLTLGYAPSQRLSVFDDEGNLSLMADLRSRIADLSVQLKLQDLESELANDVADPAARLPLGMPSLTEVLVRRSYYQEMQEKREHWLATPEAAKQDARQGSVAILKQRANDDLQQRKREVQYQLAALQEQRQLSRAQGQLERDSLTKTLEILRKQYDEERARLEQFGGSSAELQFAQEELSVATGVLTKLRDRVAAIRTERRQDGTVRSLAPAFPPRTPVELIPVKKMVLASGAAFCVPFLLGLLWEFKIQRLADSSAVEKNSSLAPVVGEVAMLPTGSTNAKSHRIFEESIDSLRVNLFLSTETKTMRSIAVTSSLSGEGKSSVASQLALSLTVSSPLVVTMHPPTHLNALTVDVED